MSDTPVNGQAAPQGAADPFEETNAKMARIPIPDIFEKTEPVGIGGWMILPIIGIVSSIILTLKEFVLTSWTDVWLVIQSDLPQFAMLRATFIWSIFAGIAFVAGNIYALVKIFRRSPRVPLIMTVLYIGMVVLSLGTMVGDQIIASVTNQSVDPMVSISNIIGRIIAASIWIPYFHNSKRVANTFKPREAAKDAELGNVFS